MARTHVRSWTTGLIQSFQIWIQEGATESVTYDALGRKIGTFRLFARLESDVTPGTTSEVVQITVT